MTINRRNIDTAIAQTPCLCGDTNTWHPECYQGKSPAEIKRDYAVAYKQVRRKLKQQAKSEFSTFIEAASMANTLAAAAIAKASRVQS